MQPPCKLLKEILQGSSIDRLIHLKAKYTKNKNNNKN